MALYLHFSQYHLPVEDYTGLVLFVPEGNINIENQLHGGDELFDDVDDVKDEVLWLRDFLYTLTIN